MRGPKRQFVKAKVSFTHKNQVHGHKTQRAGKGRGAGKDEQNTSKHEERMYRSPAGTDYQEI